MIAKEKLKSEKYCDYLNNASLIQNNNSQDFSIYSSNKNELHTKIVDIDSNVLTQSLYTNTVDTNVSNNNNNETVYNNKYFPLLQESSKGNVIPLKNDIGSSRIISNIQKLLSPTNSDQLSKMESMEENQENILLFIESVVAHHGGRLSLKVLESLLQSIHLNYYNYIQSIPYVFLMKLNR